MDLISDTKIGENVGKNKDVDSRVSSKHELDEQTRTNYEQLFVRVCSQISAN